MTATATVNLIRAARASQNPVAEKRTAIRTAHIDAVIENVTLPLEVGELTVTALTLIERAGQPWLQIDGTGPLDWPIRVNRPPIFVDDPDGDWTLRTTTPNGDHKKDIVLHSTAIPGNETLVADRRVRFDPQAALTEFLAAL